ncbi:zinc finger protein 892-like [Phlebotomus argentipes]|uniref:zinc finger protein 892-like n=1 Tax=Phlebotomus argentipes TaxID=94469 RepID=UPI0028934098|nr:zinc finger protein 892-like [Phlebotomus argentipes]
MKSAKTYRGSGNRAKNVPKEALCRLCLTTSSDCQMTDIFAADGKTSLCVRIMACTSLEITSEDALPRKICASCSELLSLFYAFRRKCKSSDAKYRRFLRLENAGKVKSIDDLSDDEEDEEYSKALEEFNDRQKHALDENLKIAKEEMTRNYDEEMKNLLQEEKLRIYREEKQKIQETAMRQIVSTLRQKEKDEKKVAEMSESKGKVYRISKKPTEVKDEMEVEIIMQSSLKEDSCQSDEDYTVSVLSEGEYEESREPEESPVENTVEEKEEDNEVMEILYTDDITKEDELDEGEEFEYLEEREDDESLAMEPVDNEEAQIEESSGSQTRDSKQTQNIELEIDDEKYIYLELEEEAEVEKTTKYCDEKGDLLIFSCSMCPKTFSREKSLKNHEMSHRQRKGFSCTFCEKWFPSNSSRMRHERIHTGEKPFMCNICGRKFVQKEILKRHVVVHSGDKPFKCHHCDKQFTQKEILRQHINRKHTENPVVELHKCFLCPKSFYHASGLSRHLLVHAGRTFPCETCGKEFVDKSALKRHIGTIHKELPA